MTTPTAEGGKLLEQNQDRPKMSLWVDQRRSELRWETENGPVLMSHPRVMTPDEIVDLEAVLAITLKVIRRTSEKVAAHTKGADYA